MLRGAPVLILGDFSCPLDSLLPLIPLLQASALRDVYPHVRLAGQQSPPGACQGHGAKRETRRDFVPTSASRRVEVSPTEGL
eukprot:6027381-Alexandrium_andersonii.AAC.1